MTCDAACLRKGAFVVNFFHFDIFVISCLGVLENG